MAVTPSPLGAALDVAVDAVLDLCRCCTAGLGAGPLPLSPDLADLQARLDGSDLAALAAIPAPAALPRPGEHRIEVARRIDADIAAALRSLASATVAGVNAGADRVGVAG